MVAERTDYVQLLGAEIRNRRMARGMSLRALAKELNLSGHGTLVDYEHGRRIPPEDMVSGLERVFEVSDGALRNLREKALAERANIKTEELLRPPAEPAPEPAVTPKGRRWMVIVGVGLVLATGAVIGMVRLSDGTDPAQAASVRFGFESGDQRWNPLWGNDKVEYLATSAAAFEGRKSLQVTTIRSSNGDDKAIGTTHGLAGLRPGMKVSVYLRVPGPERASVRFFAYNSKSDPVWAKESPIGDELALPTDANWKQYVWTVPKVDEVHAIGIEIYQIDDAPVILWVDAVNW